MKLYSSYSFTEKDPIIDKVRTAMQSRDASYGHISDASGVSVSTLRNWFEGDTRRPQYATVAAALGGLGYELVIHPREAKVVPIHQRRKASR